MAMLEISVVPVGAGTSLGEFVAQCVRIARDSGLPWTLTPMGTVIEGNLDDLLVLAARMHREPFRHGVRRVVTTIKIDDRTDREMSADSKVKSVLSRL